MTAEDVSFGRRKEPRFQITNPGVLRTVIHREDRNAESIEGELMDLSKNGLRLAVGQALPKGEAVRVVIEAPSIGLSIEAASTVCWCTPGVNASWFLGCTLTKRITDKQVADLAVSSALERRRDPRKPISLEAEGKSELGTEYQPLQLVNFSEGGFCVFSRTPLARPGERLMLRIAHPTRKAPVNVHAKVVWDTQLAEGHSAGCRFLAREDYLQLLQTSQAIERTRRTHLPQLARGTNWRIVAATISVILTFQLVRMVQNDPAPTQPHGESTAQRTEPPTNLLGN